MLRIACFTSNLAQVPAGGTQINLGSKCCHGVRDAYHAREDAVVRQVSDAIMCAKPGVTLVVYNACLCDTKALGELGFKFLISADEINLLKAACLDE